ncbi:MAG: NINE protein [Clostridia bacterium]|nr:NINE protein [Clostridia bacterium]
MKKCEYCGRTAHDSDKFCSGCGANQFRIICANCGNEYSDGLFCPKCGVKAGQQAKICPDCNTEYYTNACPNCGYTANREIVVREVYQPEEYSEPVREQVDFNGNVKSKSVALLLCVLLGLFGAHKFYEGKIVMGIVYLFTYGLFGIGWILDIIAIALKPSQYIP